MSVLSELGIYLQADLKQQEIINVPPEEYLITNLQYYGPNGKKISEREYFRIHGLNNISSRDGGGDDNDPPETSKGDEEPFYHEVLLSSTSADLDDLVTRSWETSLDDFENPKMRDINGIAFKKPVFRGKEVVLFGAGISHKKLRQVYERPYQSTITWFYQADSNRCNTNNHGNLYVIAENGELEMTLRLMDFFKRSWPQDLMQTSVYAEVKTHGWFSTTTQQLSSGIAIEDFDVNI